MQKENLVDNNTIAIIIPAYKNQFLEKALLSLVSQTNKNFTVYIGDDHSPNDLYTICRKFESILDIHYIRFDNNIGGENIVDQWKRCIALSKNEKWIWLFSDDDIADCNCVESFYNLLEKLGDDNKVEVYRFNTRVIDDNDVFRGKSEDSPFFDSSLNMAYDILHGKRGNSMPDHIFSRKLYEKYGILETKFAQAADWGTSIRFALENGIYTIPNACISWRLGDFNISGQVKFFPERALRGHLQFLIWILDFFSKNITPNDRLKYIDIQYATEANLLLVINNHYKRLSLKSFFNIYEYYRRKESNIVLASMKSFRLYFRSRKILTL